MPTYTTTAPDGNTYSVTGPEGATDAQVRAEVLRQNPSAGTPKQAPHSMSDRLINGAKNLYGGFLEPAATMVSGMVAQPVAGIAGVGQMANNALGIGPQQDPVDVVRSTQNALTYQPRTDTGKAATQLAGKVASAPGRLMDRMGLNGQSAAEATGSPAYGAATDAVTGALPMILGLKVPGVGAAKVADAAASAVEAAPRQAAIDAAKDAGYVLPPSEITNAPVGKVLTGIAGKTQLNDTLALHNQKVTNNIAKAEVGVPTNTPLDADALDAAAASANKAYEAVRKADQNIVIARNPDGSVITNAVGKPIARPAGPVRPDAKYTQDIADIGADRANPSFGTEIDPQVKALKQQYGATSSYTPSDGISAVKQLRADAKADLRATDNPSQLALGRAKMQAADAIESQISRYLDASGQTSLYKNFTDARTRLAKIDTVKDAMDASGNVDAAAINSYRNRGGYVDGGLKKIADAADSFGNVVRNTQKVQPPAPFSALDYAVNRGVIAGGIAGGGAVAGHTGIGSGLIAADIAAQAARPAARAFLNSNAYQGTLGGVTPTASALSQLAAKPGSPLAWLALSGNSGQK